MKLNLLYGEGAVIGGYINLHPFAQQETEDVKVSDVKNLERWVCDAEAKEIMALDVVDYCMVGEVQRVIQHWIQKLRHGGKLIIGGTDLTQVCNAVSNYQISLEDANVLLHGSQKQPHLVKRVNLSMIGMIKFLSSEGLKITKKRREGYNYVVEATRP